MQIKTEIMLFFIYSSGKIIKIFSVGQGVGKMEHL